MYELTIKGENPQNLKEELSRLLSMFEVIQPLPAQITPTPIVQTPVTKIMQPSAEPPATQSIPIMQPIPTTTVVQEYTLPQIQTAMGGLADSGKMAVIQKIMAEFGVGAVIDIPKERYGELVTRLRTEGAQI